jgi:DNA-directed RNA polymerase subunit RPC12/RpoP
MSTAETMRFICAGCGYRARIPSSYDGKVILCPGCKQMQIASSDAGVATGDTVRIEKVSTAQGAAVSIPDSDGRLRFTCGGCGYSAKLASTYAGKAIACPECKSPQLIPPLQGPEGSAGKKLPPPAPTPSAETKAEDELAFDDEPTAAPAKAVQKPAQTVAHDPLDDISFDQEPQGQAAAPSVIDVANKDVKKPGAMGKSPTPSGRTDSSAQSSKPGSGKIVRRGNRMPLATTADSPDEDTNQADDQPPKPSKPLPPWVQKMKQPHLMAIIGGSFALLIVLIVLISAWSSASSDAKTYKESAEKAEKRALILEKIESDAEFEHGKTQSELKALKKSSEEAKAALVAAETRITELSEKVKQVEAQKTEENVLRKKAESAYDEIFANRKKLEKQRDDDYQRSNDLRKKYEEELKLRKDLQERVQNLVKEQAAAK